MQQWTASNAEIVLNELDRRLKLIDHSAALPQPKLRKVVSVFVRLVVF